MTIPSNNSDEGVYEIIVETADILYDYSDTKVVARYPTLAAANEAARGWLITTLTYESLPLPLTDDEIEETFGPSGETSLSYCSDELDFTVTVKYVPSTPTVKSSNKVLVFCALKQVECVGSGGGVQLVGVYRSEERANQAAEGELRREAGIKSWRDRRRLKMADYREEYDLEKGFEGEWRRGDGAMTVRVWVEGRELE
ncbi:hypothetical protein K440DRAFT_657593 [Wilcoxina mikolae CBS 423.85]|nr:hypothetical protein K440DRAFT_657593 [Wilcoxina mikolae CBS 423.85]